MSADHYRTISARVEFRHKIERSEFLGIAFPVLTEPEFFAELHKIEKQHYDATHHCWAFSIREGEDPRVRSSDAGEPSGTAGRPIAAAIEGSDLQEVAVVVVRWFGGVKLGTGGLSRAYRETAAETLRLAQIEDRYLYDHFEVDAPFDSFGVVYRLVGPPDVVLVAEEFADTPRFKFDVRRSRADEFARQLVERRLVFRKT